MNAIAECAKAINGMECEQGQHKMKQLQQLTETVIDNNPETAERLLRQPADLAAKTDDNNTAATDSRQRVPRVHAGAVQRV